MEHQERKREIQLREKRQLDITSRQSAREKVQGRERESKRGEMGRDKERGETVIKICTECTEERLQRDPPF